MSAMCGRDRGKDRCYHLGGVSIFLVRKVRPAVGGPSPLARGSFRDDAMTGKLKLVGR